jgi:hypothetical protein
MDARRARILAGSALLGLLASASAAPAAAADCTLSSPTYVNVGTQITIDGTGFPASTDVDISISLDGSPTDAFTLLSDTGGSLEIALTPEDIDIGVTTIQATAGTACTASVTYSVLAAGATPPPAPAEEPDAGPGNVATAPGTDKASGVGGDSGSPGPSFALALALVAAGSAGLFLTRSPRRR